MSKTSNSLFRFAARAFATAVGADIIHDFIDAAHVSDLHDAIANANDIHDATQNVADLHDAHGSLWDAWHDPAPISAGGNFDYVEGPVAIDPTAVHGGGIGTGFGGPIPDIYGNPAPVSLRDLGYTVDPTGSGVNASFGGVLGGGPASDGYGNGPMDGQGNNPYRNVWGHTPQNIQGNPVTP